jgi:hypothetical protein
MLVCTMQELLAGVVAPQAMEIFEHGMTPFVKSRMLAHFAEPSDSAYNLEQTQLIQVAASRESAAQADYSAFLAAQSEVLTADRTQLQVHMRAANDLRSRLRDHVGYRVRCGDAEQRAELEALFMLPDAKEVRLRCEAFVKKLPDWADASLKTNSVKEREVEVSSLCHMIEQAKVTEKEATQPLYIQKCREPVGRKTKSYVYHSRAARVWDVYILTSILRGFMEDVFAKDLELRDPHYAKELLLCGLQFREFRTMRAHGRMPTEFEVLDMLQHLSQVLRICADSKVGAHLATARDQVDAKLTQVHHLLEATKTAGATCTEQLSAGDARRMVVPSPATVLSCFASHMRYIIAHARLSPSYTGAVPRNGGL